MEFTYDGYESLIKLLKENNYIFSHYNDYNNYEKSVILRHDVDLDLDASLDLADLEYKNNVKSTYFLLLTSDFYNLFSKSSEEKIKHFISCGHSIGLHFDETKYTFENANGMKKYVDEEIQILSKLAGQKIDVVSMHRPSKWILESNIQFDGIINTYSKEYFNDVKYISDSRMCWREDVEKIIESKKFDRIQLLTHAIWYKEQESNIRDILEQLINKKTEEVYGYLSKNITNFDEIISVNNM